MRETYEKVFNDKKKLDEMLALYLHGRSLSSLGRLYGVDHTSILFQVKKAGFWKKYRKKILFPKVKIKKTKRRLKSRKVFNQELLEKIGKEVIDEENRKKRIEEKFNQEKEVMNYEDYLIEEERKKLKKIEKCEHPKWVKRCSCCNAILDSL